MSTFSLEVFDTEKNINWVDDITVRWKNISSNCCDQNAREASAQSLTLLQPE